jgi:hypothetical protein
LIGKTFQGVIFVTAEVLQWYKIYWVRTMTRVVGKRSVGFEFQKSTLHTSPHTRTIKASSRINRKHFRAKHHVAFTMLHVLPSSNLFLNSYYMASSNPYPSWAIEATLHFFELLRHFVLDTRATLLFSYVYRRHHRQYSPMG